jgi:hypothetical protein
MDVHDIALLIGIVAAVFFIAATVIKLSRWQIKSSTLENTMHTPGPWKIEPATAGFREPCSGGARDMAIVGADGTCPGVLWDGVVGELAQQQAANAKLIAAAPDMLEALQFVAKYAALRADRDDAFPSQLVRSVRAAIAKATQD